MMPRSSSFLIGVLLIRIALPHCQEASMPNNDMQNCSAGIKGDICQYLCRPRTFPAFPNYLGIDPFLMFGYAVCDGGNWVVQSACLGERNDEIYDCPALNSLGVLEGCSSTKTNYFCDFVCDPDYGSNPFLRFHGMNPNEGKVFCLGKERWLSTDLCVRYCSKIESPLDDNCICLPGNGPNSTGYCNACVGEEYSMGYETCKPCEYKYQNVNENNDFCYDKNITRENRNAVCKRISFEGVEPQEEISLKVLKLAVKNVTEGTYVCQKGYTVLAETLSYTCHKDLNLSIKDVCSKNCDGLIKNARIPTQNEEHEFLSTVEYRCDEGLGINGNYFILSGNATCGIGGRWEYENQCSSESSKTLTVALLGIATFTTLFLVTGIYIFLM